MKQSIRQKIYKLKPIHRLIRCIVYNSDYHFYAKLNKQHNFDKHFAEIKDSCKGKRCFIIGNGPSLTAQDLDKLINEDCFASNFIYKIFSETDWRPKYYAAVDRYLELEEDIINGCDCNVYIGSYRWRHNKVDLKNAVCLRTHQPLSNKKCDFSEELKKCVYVTSTVSYVLMQIAAYMGYSEIYLLGFDHNYSYEIDEHGKIVKNYNIKSHYYSAPNDSELADVKSMTMSYYKMLNYCNENGIVIKNATRGGKLEVFDRVDFDSLFDENSEK